MREVAASIAIVCTSALAPSIVKVVDPIVMEVEFSSLSGSFSFSTYCLERYPKLKDKISVVLKGCKEANGYEVETIEIPVSVLT